MADTPNPLLTRVQAGLGWPAWTDWAETTPATPTPATPMPASASPAAATPGSQTPTLGEAERKAEVELRLSRAKTVAEGGPYLRVFDVDSNQLGAGALADYTFAIKDLVAVAGEPVTAGSEVRSDAPAEQRSAPIVEMLESHGATATGRVTLHEFAFGVTGLNDFAGTAVNPAAPDRVPGGSSSGSAAAVADGSARIAIGTDTGGSVRIPASFCGVVGFKPSSGLYPAAGVFPLSATLDHVGLFATSTKDIVEVHATLGYEVERNPSLPRRVGVARTDLEAADPDVRSAITEALDRLAAAGCEVVDVAWPDPEETFVASTAIMFSEAAAIHHEQLAVHRDRYGADILARLQLGADLSGPQVAAAHLLRQKLIGEVLATLAGVDVIASPTTPVVAPLLTEAANPVVAPRVVANTRLGNVVGLPAVSIPVATDGPPVGLQILGVDDPSTLAAALTIEAIVA